MENRRRIRGEILKPKSLRYETTIRPYYEKSPKDERKRITKNLRHFVKQTINAMVEDEYEFWNMRRKCP
jgi:hypothetical protein